MKFYAVSGIAVLAAAALSISMIIGSGKNLAANINSSTVEEKTESNILVLYFTSAENAEIDNSVDAVSSASLNPVDGNIVGNTKLIADYVHEKTGGDIVNIEAENLYPAGYEEHVDLASDELDSNARPAIKTHIDNFDKYDTVYLLYPIWWGTMPMPVYTFMEAHDFSGKTVVPIATHKGSSMGSTQKDIEKALPNAKVIKGFSVEGDNAVNARDEVNKKLDEIEF